MLENALTENLQLKFPIWQAPLPFNLFEAAYSGKISEQGALGLLRIGSNENKLQLQESINLYKQYSDKLAVCFTHQLPKQLKAKKTEFIPNNMDIELTLSEADHFEDLLTLVLNEGVHCIGFANGLPDQEIIDLIKEQNCQTFAICHNLLESLVCEKMDIDFIVLRGGEAGGERFSFDNKLVNPILSSFSLLQQTRKYVSKPIILWGDFSHGADIVSAIISGAQGVMLDRLLLNCADSGLSEAQYDLMANATEYQSVVESTFTARKMRFIKNDTIINDDIPHEYREQIYHQYFLTYPEKRPLAVCQTQCDTQNSLAERLEELQQQISEYLS